MEILDVYKPLFYNPPKTRYFLITGSRGSGKSYTVNLMLLNLTYEQGQVILFTRYTLVSAYISIIPEFIEKIQLLGKTNDFDITQSEIINRKTGSRILFKGIKTSTGINTANLKSIAGVTTFVVEEAEELVDENVFDRIDLSVREKSRPNRVILIMNPTTKEHWIYKRFVQDAGVAEGFNGQKNDTSYIHTTYLQNRKNLSPSFLAQAERVKLTNPEKYNHVFLGAWLSKAEGVIFTNWIVGEFDKSLPYAYGLDFGFHPDPTVMLKVAMDRKAKKIYIRQVFYEPYLTTSDILHRIKAEVGMKDNMIIADSSEPRLIAELHSKGINIYPAQKGPDSVINGIRFIQEYQLIVTPESNKVVMELNNYVWSDKKNSTPVDAYNHGIDSLRYSIGAFLRPRRKFVAV